MTLTELQSNDWVVGRFALAGTYGQSFVYEWSEPGRFAWEIHAVQSAKSPIRRA